MSGPTLTIETSGLGEGMAAAQAIRNALADRRPLHAELAGHALEFTRGYLRRLNRHKTAQRLGARPTNHYERSAMAIQGESDESGAILRIPRSTGLGRAFGFVVIRPTGGRKFLTIPASAETYGRQAGEWPEDTFYFATVRISRGPMPVLMWAADGGNHKKGEVAFWLRRAVYQKQDPTLLPSDEAYLKLGEQVLVAHIENLIDGAAGNGGGEPYGGISTGMPSA